MNYTFFVKKHTIKLVSYTTCYIYLHYQNESQNDFYKNSQIIIIENKLKK